MHRLTLGLCATCVAVLLGCASSVSAQAIVTNLGDGIDLVDVGLDPVSNELVFVGSELESGQEVPKVFKLSSDRSSLTSSELISVRDSAEVFGISSDGSRIAGLSNFADPSKTEATTWLSSAPATGLGLGFNGSSTELSGSFGSWSGGVVGSNDGSSDAFKWSSQGNDFQILPDIGGNSEASDVSSDGSIVVGFSSAFGATAGAVFWDDTGINQLDDPFGSNSVATSISPNAEYIGGEMIFIDLPFTVGNQAAVWSGEGYSLTQLAWEDGSRVMGRVNDVTSSGYAVGETTDGRGFIWHESFNGVDTSFLGAQIFDDWLLETQGVTLASPSSSIVGVAESALGQLHFAVNGPATIVSNVQPSGVALVGDFDSDGDVDADDIDFYAGKLDTPATGDLVQLDLDGDQFVTLADHDLHITTLVQIADVQTGTLIGDITLDGSVDVLNDAFALVGGLGTGTGGYANGDLNADLVINVLGDAFRLVVNLGMTNEP